MYTHLRFRLAFLCLVLLTGCNVQNPSRIANQNGTAGPNTNQHVTWKTAEAEKYGLSLSIPGNWDFQAREGNTSTAESFLVSIPENRNGNISPKATMILIFKPRLRADNDQAKQRNYTLTEYLEKSLVATRGELAPADDKMINGLHLTAAVETDPDGNSLIRTYYAELPEYFLEIAYPKNHSEKETLEKIIDSIRVNRENTSHKTSENKNRNTDTVAATPETGFSFEPCGNPQKYAKASWYPDLEKGIEKLPLYNDYDRDGEGKTLKNDRNLTMQDIAELCYDTENHLAIILIPARIYGGDGFRLLQFDTVDKNLKQATREDIHGGKNTPYYKKTCETAIKAGEKNCPETFAWFDVPDTLGVMEQNRFYPTAQGGDGGCFAESSFVYDIAENHLSISEQCNQCGEDKATRQCSTYDN